MKKIKIRMYHDGIPNANAHFTKRSFQSGPAYNWKISPCMFELFRDLKPVFGKQLPKLKRGDVGPYGFGSVVINIGSPWEEVILRTAAAKYNIMLQEVK